MKKSKEQRKAANVAHEKYRQDKSLLQIYLVDNLLEQMADYMEKNNISSRKNMVEMAVKNLIHEPVGIGFNKLLERAQANQRVRFAD